MKILYVLIIILFISCQTFPNDITFNGMNTSKMSSHSQFYENERTFGDYAAGFLISTGILGGIWYICTTLEIGKMR